MRLRTYVLFVTLLVLLSLCCVHESVRQKRAKYDLAGLLQAERRLKEQTAAEQAEIAELTSPARLESLVRTLNFSVEPLQPLPPEAGRVPGAAR